jgi:hypothetical protein
VLFVLVTPESCVEQAPSIPAHSNTNFLIFMLLPFEVPLSRHRDHLIVTLASHQIF